jgi:ABC-2 type transport system ATP-binding protein
LLEVRVLSKTYGNVVAVEDVSFSIPQGICFGLLGPNGAGKSTAISIIAGTLDADSGVVLLDGQPVSTNARKVKQRIGYVPQDLALYEDLTAAENLRFFGMLYGLGGSLLTERVDAALTIGALNDRQKQAVRTFSGGMKRRLNIAAALLHDPDLLILDEPTVGVDPQSRNLIFEALSSLLSAGKTLLYTTHYMEEVERLCQAAAIIDKGKVIANGPLNELHRLVPSRCVVHFDLEKPLSGDLSGLPEALSLARDGRTVSLETGELSRDLPSALEEIKKHGGRVENIRTERPSLEQVFLHLTGRTLRD